VALPALTLSYFGQGALLLTHPTALASPFFELAPPWAHVSLIVLSTIATVIASQSIISGAFSLTHQSMQLGFLPRMTVIHTAGREIGQIYVPFVNWALAALTLTAVIGFGSSDALAGAFGIAVSLLMAITTLMATFVALQWNYSVWAVVLVNGSLLVIDLLFFASTSTKLIQGGWFPLLTAGVISFLMLTWRKGEQIMDGVRSGLRRSLHEFAEAIKRDPPHRLPGTAAVLGRLTQGVPLALTQNLKYNHVMHENLLLVSVLVAEIPRVPATERAVVTSVCTGVTRVELHYGFMEQPNVPLGLGEAVSLGRIEPCRLESVIYFTGHETINALGRLPQMARWRESVYTWMHRNAQRPGAYFKIPASQIMEIGVEFEI
jgi:KUP system potassium uptake protein